MKKSTLIAIIVGLVAFLGAVAGALYVLKRKGIIAVDEEYECEFEDNISDGLDRIDSKAKDYGKKAKKEAKQIEKKVEGTIDSAEEKVEGAVDEVRNHFGF